jgi:hypothetical protein
MAAPTHDAGEGAPTNDDRVQNYPYSLDAERPDPGGPAPNAVTVEPLLRRAAGTLLPGDAGGRDKLVFLVGDRQPMPLREVSPLLREPVRHAFVAPERWAETRAEFRHRRLMMLSGDPGRGRVAAAIRLLDMPPDRTILHLDRQVDVRRLAAWLEADAAGDRPLPLGAGFLLADPADPAITEGAVLHQIAAALDATDARMVLTVDTDHDLDDEARSYAVPLGRPRPHADILESHLRWRLGQRSHPDPTATARRILADRSIQELVPAGAPVKAAADLAMMIDQEYDGAAVDGDRLRQRLAERPADDFAIWFEALPDVRTRSLAITLAVLDGLSYESVVRAAGRLADLLDGPPQVVAPAAPMLQPPWHDPFADARGDRLRLLRARTRRSTKQGLFGRTPVEIVEYVDEGRPATILDHVWHRYGMHGPLLAWLAELARDPAEDVRIWAGTALGLLSTYAFDLVYGTVLQRMTTSDNRQTRDVVAYALRVPAAESRMMPLVRRVANRLHANAAQPLGQATGARLRAIAFGPLAIDPVLEKMDRLAILDDHRIATAVANSLADLMAQNEDENAPVVLRRVAGWLDDRWRNRVAQWVFHELARSLRADVDRKTPDSAKPSWVTWPALLLLADRRPELRPVLVGMWGKVLNTGQFPGRVADAMDDWGSWAESYEEVRIAFVRLLTATAALSPRTRTIVLRHAARWHAVDELFPLTLTAHAVESALNARNDAP